MQTTKKQKIIIAASVLLLAAVVATGLYIASRANNPLSVNMTSNKSTITLTQGKEVKEIRNGMQIAGGYTATKDQALFYTVTDQKKQLVGSGTILPDDTHHFSRNLALDTTNLKDGAELELKIYTQSNKGAIVDELSITGVFAAQ